MSIAKKTNEFRWVTATKVYAENDDHDCMELSLLTQDSLLGMQIHRMTIIDEACDAVTSPTES